MARIVFDLDGTLIDSARDIHALANRVLATVDAPPITLAQTRQFVGNGAPTFVERMCRASGVGPEDGHQVLSLFLDGYSGAVDLTEVYPNVPAVLDQLLAHGHSLGICTNKPLAPARAVLDHVGLLPYFTVVIGGDSLPTVKPDPAPLVKAFADLGAGPTIFVGDSDVDAETAKRAGVPFLLFAEGYSRTKLDDLPSAAVFDDFNDLPRLIQTCLERGG
ncbi:MAG: phosphoglycolate phosphatase [Pseudomonadota bacterium]